LEPVTLVVKMGSWKCRK